MPSVRRPPNPPFLERPVLPLFLWDKQKYDITSGAIDAARGSCGKSTREATQVARMRGTQHRPPREPQPNPRELSDRSDDLRTVGTSVRTEKSSPRVRGRRLSARKGCLCIRRPPFGVQRFDFCTRKSHFCMRKLSLRVRRGPVRIGGNVLDVRG